MKTWLVTGGAGFIGSNFVRLMAPRKKARVVVLDALTYAGNLANIKDLIDSRLIQFIRGDIGDFETVTRVFKDEEITDVIHFAAESHVDRSILGPKPFVRTNIEGTFNLLEAARSAWSGKSDRRFLHVSTDEVYGDLEVGAPGFNETSRYEPSSPYSASKAASDHLARAWFRTYGLPVVVTNCSNNYGPWQFPEKLIPLMILNAMEGRELQVYGDGQQIRDWLHVEDHCEALATVLAKGILGETYLIGGNCERPNLTVVHAICDHVDRVLERTPGSARKLIRYVTDRPGHDRRYAVDSSRLQRELGWRPRWKLEDALPDLVRWYRDHSAWSAQIKSGEYRNF